LAAEVAGWMFLDIFRIINEVFGEPVFQQVIVATQPTTRKVLGETIRVMGWYPYSAYADLLRATQSQLENHDAEICKRLGELGGMGSMRKMFQVYKKIGDPERLILSASKIWDKHFRGAGKLETMSALPENTRWRIVGFAEMSALHCKLHEGWIKGSLVEAGSSVGLELTCDPVETECTRRGALHHEFFCTWKPMGNGS